MLMSTFTPTSTSTTTLKWNKFEHFYHSPFPGGRKEGPTKHLKSIFLVENSLFFSEMLGKQLNSTFETTLELSSTMLFVKQLFSFLSFWVVAVFLRSSISFFLFFLPSLHYRKFDKIVWSFTYSLSVPLVLLKYTYPYELHNLLKSQAKSIAKFYFWTSKKVADFCSWELFEIVEWLN